MAPGRTSLLQYVRKYQRKRYIGQTQIAIFDLKDCTSNRNLQEEHSQQKLEHYSCLEKIKSLQQKWGGGGCIHKDIIQDSIKALGPLESIHKNITSKLEHKPLP